MSLKVDRKKIISVCIVAVVFVLAAFLCRPVFYLNDDVTMRSIMSGRYSGTPDGHAVYMKYPLTGAISVLYAVSDDLPWLELFFAGCLIWAAAVTVSALADKGKGIFWELLIGILLLLPFFWYMHYTIIAAVLAGTAAFWLCTGKKGVGSALLWLLAWMIRSQIAYLSLPFLGVAVLWRLSGVRRELRKKECCSFGKTGGILLVGLLLCMGVNSLAYAGAPWQEYLQYNDVRTALFDYTNFHSTDYYGEHFEQYGMTEAEFLVLDSYNTMLDASVDTEKIDEVADRVSGWMAQERDEAAWMKECVHRYYYQIRYGDSMYVILWLVMFAVLTLLLVLGRSWMGVSLMICLGGGRSLIWVYLIYQGRFPERIIVSLYVIELLLLAGMLCNLPIKCKENLDKIKHKLAEKWKRIPQICMAMQAVFVVVAACLLTEQVKAESPKVQAQQEIQQEWNVLKEYCESHEDTLYLIDVFSAVEYGGFQYETDCGNMMLAGGWMSNSPLAMRRFESRGAADGGQALFEDTGTVFLAEDTADVKWLENYLNARFGVCTLKPVKEIVCGENKVFVEYHVIKQ